MFGDDEDIRSYKDLAEDYRRGMEAQDSMIADYRRDNETLLAERNRLRDAIEALRAYAEQTHSHWDADEYHKVGKRLLAMSGRLTGYDATIDEALKLGKVS